MKKRGFPYAALLPVGIAGGVGVALQIWSPLEWCGVFLLVNTGLWECIDIFKKGYYAGKS